MARFNLAIDLGRSSNIDKSDRYVIIDICKLFPDIKKSGFSTYDEAIKFTSSYQNYTQLFLHALSAGLVTEDMAGKPFTFCYEGSKKIWKHYGDNSYLEFNKVLFRDDAKFMAKPDSKVLKDAYFNGSKVNIILPLTNIFLGYEINIPEYFDYYKAPLKEQEKVHFIEELIKALNTIINEKKKSTLYGINENYTAFIDIMKGNVDDISMYITKAVYEHDVRSNYFSNQLKNVMNGLCLKRDDKKQTYVVDNSVLYELATFYKAFNEKYSYYSTYNMEIIELQNTLKNSHNLKPEKQEDDNEVKQVTMFGELVPFDNKKRGRKI